MILNVMLFWKQKPWVILCVCLWNGLQHLFFFFLAMCLFSITAQIGVKYITGQFDDFWFDFTSWRSGLGRTKHPGREKVMVLHPLPLLISLLCSQTPSFSSLRLSLWLDVGGGLSYVIFLWWMCDLFIRNCRYTVFVHNSNYND